MACYTSTAALAACLAAWATFLVPLYVHLLATKTRKHDTSPPAAAGENRHGGGTFGYTAPEVIFGTRPAHGSQDAWAVGHMLLIMLTKRRHRASNMFRHSVSQYSLLLSGTRRGTGLGAYTNSTESEKNGIGVPALFGFPSLLSCVLVA